MRIKENCIRLDTVRVATDPSCVEYRVVVMGRWGHVIGWKLHLVK
jgi:hypothetical protein